MNTNEVLELQNKTHCELQQCEQALKLCGDIKTAYNYLYLKNTNTKQTHIENRTKEPCTEAN